MIIYVVPNLTQPVTNYVCDSQETINARPINEQTGEPYVPLNWCVVGTQADADSILLANQQELLTQQAALFTVNLQTTVEDGVVWTLVDLKTEPENNDRQYFLLSPIDGLYQPAVGLDAAKVLFTQIQKEYIQFIGIDKYTTLTFWTK